MEAERLTFVNDCRFKKLGPVVEVFSLFFWSG